MAARPASNSWLITVSGRREREMIEMAAARRLLAMARAHFRTNQSGNGQGHVYLLIGCDIKVAGRHVNLTRWLFYARKFSTDNASYVFQRGLSFSLSSRASLLTMLPCSMHEHKQL